MSSPEIPPPTACVADWKRTKQRLLFASLVLILVVVALFLHSSLSKPDVLNLGTEETTETLTQTESAPSAAVSQAELAEGPQPTPEQQSEPKKPFEPKPERETAVSPSTTCDLSVGSWVANPSRQPQYTGESCKSLSRAFNCQRNGRVNMRYLQYEWRSPGCRIERFDASAFLEHMRNKVFLVVGDSVSMNFFGALQCLLETATPTKVSPVHATFPSSTLIFLPACPPNPPRDGPLFPGGPNTYAVIAPHLNAHFPSSTLVLVLPACPPNPHGQSRDGPLFPGGPRTRALIAPQFNATFLSHASSFLVQSTPSVHLDQAHLGQAHLDQTHLDQAHLDQTHLDQTHLDQAHLDQTHLDQAHLDQAHLDQAHLDQAHLDQTHLDQAHLDQVHLDQTHLDQAHLDQAHLDQTHLDQAHLDQTHLDQAHLDQTHLDQAHLDQAHLDQAHLDQAHLDQTHLDQAHLDQTHLDQAHLDQAHLDQAHLDQAHLDQTHLDQAHLDQAHLDQAHLDQAHLDTTCCSTLLSGASSHLPHQGNKSTASTRMTHLTRVHLDRITSPVFNPRDRTTASPWTVHLYCSCCSLHAPLQPSLPLTPLHSPLSTLPSPLTPLHSPLSTLPSPFSPLHSPLSTLPSPLSPLHSPLSTHPSPLSPLHSPLSTLPSPLSPLHSPLSTLPSPLSPLHSPLSTHPSPLSPLHSPLSTLPLPPLPQQGDRTTASTWTVHLDQVHPNWSPVLPYSDYVVFGTGAWYTIVSQPQVLRSYVNARALICLPPFNIILHPPPTSPLQADLKKRHYMANLKKRHYMVDNKEQPSENRMATMQTALHTVARFTRSINYTGVPMLLTYSPVHEKVRLNSTARELGCSSYMRPVGVEALEGAQWAADAMDARNAQIEVGLERC
ncbi:unnamed protein product [Closterium sp. NIES-65]|nr:unnamed protein product [Closterium sp. NIES-65]